MRFASLLTVGLVLAFASSVPASAAQTAYLKIEGVSGESTQASKAIVEKALKAQKVKFDNADVQELTSMINMKLAAVNQGGEARGSVEICGQRRCLRISWRRR
ncbi:MAG: hypothetical protein HC850_10680 [Rhodomicrobium sp.]|nr:hypothetical protein [Rhodomicrobium sp.]